MLMQNFVFIWVEFFHLLFL